MTAASPCANCGFDPSAGVVRRHAPGQTRGLTAVALKFGRWSFGFAALMVVASYIYFDDITRVEESGGSFSADPFTGLIYEAAGKWAAVGFWLLAAALMVVAGMRALSLERAEKQ